MDRSNPRPDATRAAVGVPSGGFAPALALDVAGVIQLAVIGVVCDWLPGF